MTRNPSFLREIDRASGEKVSTCFQCEKCTNGCPATFAMDIPPHKLIHMIHLGLQDDVLRSNTSWVCASCETCTTVCPNSIDIAHLMDTLRQMAARAGTREDQKDTSRFHKAFLNSVKRHGKVYELGMMVDYKTKTGGLFQDIGLGWAMFKRGKLKLLPRKLWAGGQIRAIFQKAEKAAQK